MPAKIELDLNQIHQMYWQENMSTADIGRVFNCNAETIRRRLKTIGRRKTQREAIGLGVDERVVELYQGGLSMGKVAKTLGIGETTVYNVLSRNNIPRRPLKGINKGELNGNWVGDNAQYKSLHDRVNNLRGKPKLCWSCFATDAPRYDWALIKGGSYTNMNDYIRLCRLCHKRYDIGKQQ